MNVQLARQLSLVAVGLATAKRSEARYAVLEANFLTRGLWRGGVEHDRIVAGIDAAVAALSTANPSSAASSAISQVIEAIMFGSRSG